jgi:hypothetical protein
MNNALRRGSETSTVSTYWSDDPSNDGDDSQLFFVTSYSDFDKLGTYFQNGHKYS